MICLDTNAVIAALKGGPLQLVDRLEREMLRETFALPVVALFELRYSIPKARGERRTWNGFSCFCSCR